MYLRVTQYDLLCERKMFDCLDFALRLRRVRGRDRRRFCGMRLRGRRPPRAGDAARLEAARTAGMEAPVAGTRADDRRGGGVRLRARGRPPRHARRAGRPEAPSARGPPPRQRAHLSWI